MLMSDGSISFRLSLPQAIVLFQHLTPPAIQVLASLLRAEGGVITAMAPGFRSDSVILQSCLALDKLCKRTSSRPVCVSCFPESGKPLLSLRLVLNSEQSSAGLSGAEVTGLKH